LLAHDLFRKPGPTFRDHTLNQPEPLEAGVAFLADDDVVVHGNAQRFGDIDDRLRHLDTDRAIKGIVGKRLTYRTASQRT